MARMVLNAAYIAISGVDRSASAKKVELAVEVEEKDITTFGSLGWKEVLGGIKSAGLSITWVNDVAASQLDSVMWPLLGTVVTFEVRLTQAASGASNPAYTGSVLVKSWAPVAAGVGDVVEVDVDWPTSGVVTRT